MGTGDGWEKAKTVKKAKQAGNGGALGAGSVVVVVGMILALARGFKPDFLPWEVGEDQGLIEGVEALIGAITILGSYVGAFVLKYKADKKKHNGG